MDNSSKILFKIVTPDGVVCADEVDSVNIPTSNGEIGIMRGHAPLVAVVVAGELRFKKDDQETALAVSSGVVEVRPNSEVYVLADTAERAQHIDLERAQAAVARARELMKQQANLADVDFARLQAKMEKELARLRIGKKYRKINTISIRNG